MFLFNAGAVAIISYARLGLGLFNASIWPFALLHVVMAIWSRSACLRRMRLGAAQYNVAAASEARPGID